MAGALAREANVRWSGSSTTGGPFPARVGAFGSPCAAHAHTRARAHARARPRCTLQHTFPQHCTSTTTAHFCMCKLTCPYRSGASGRGGRCWLGSGHGTAGRRRFLAIACRCGAAARPRRAGGGARRPGVAWLYGVWKGMKKRAWRASGLDYIIS